MARWLREKFLFNMFHIIIIVFSWDCLQSSPTLHKFVFLKNFQDQSVDDLINNSRLCGGKCRRVIERGPNGFMSVRRWFPFMALFFAMLKRGVHSHTQNCRARGQHRSCPVNSPLAFSFSMFNLTLNHPFDCLERLLPITHTKMTQWSGTEDHQISGVWRCQVVIYTQWYSSRWIHTTAWNHELCNQQTVTRIIDGAELANVLVELRQRFQNRR